VCIVSLSQSEERQGLGGGAVFFCFFCFYFCSSLSQSEERPERQALVRSEMSKGGRYLLCSKKYGLPLFAGAWANPGDTNKEAQEQGETLGKEGEQGIVVLAGGGGNQRSGVPNSLLLAKYDFATTVLSDAVDTFSTGDDPPLRVAVHPGGEAIVCSFEKDCRVLEVCREGENVKVVSAERDGEASLQGVGEQNCVVFSADGTRLGLGGDDGHLRVLEWPSLKVCNI
jgi:prolactin regulatory element-binding protein